MFILRTYLSALTLVFFLVTLQARDIGVLEATVIICSLLYIILDMRAELQELRSLEVRVALLRR